VCEDSSSFVLLSSPVCMFVSCLFFCFFFLTFFCFLCLFFEDVFFPLDAFSLTPVCWLVLCFIVVRLSAGPFFFFFFLFLIFRMFVDCWFFCAALSRLFVVIFLPVGLC